MTADREQPQSSLAAAVVREALAWVGTPYRHQGARKGVGCDCVGLVRGVWRALYGREAEEAGSYSLDWAEAGATERLLAGARRNFCEKPIPTARAGDLLLFRWRSHLPAKHAGILVADRRFVHAYQSAGSVSVSELVPQWRGRIAAAFAFPELVQIST